MSYLYALMERIVPAKIPGGEGDNAEAGQALLTERAVRDLCWSTMLYRCEKCEFTWRVFLALGVEGPKSLRRHDLYVPCPFMIGCPAWPNMEVCDGKMSHIDWNKDETFSEPVVPGDGEPRFVLPDSGGIAGRLVIPARAQVEARRFHNE